MIKTYSAWFGDFTLDPETDFYGELYWERISSKTYEPDTMVFLENNLDANTDFVDVGAATGAMSIIAGNLGARVLAFEAVPRVFEIAEKHIYQNQTIASRIMLRNAAVSSMPGYLELGEKADSRILASISNKDTSNSGPSLVNVVSLIDEIDLYRNPKSKLVIKIDIEGAEWKLLADGRTLEGLSRHKALILLAIHPGFYRPFKNLPLGLTFFTKKFWQIQNLYVAVTFFRRIMKVATVRRTSSDKVYSVKKCVLLMFGGYFEFILDFDETL